MKNFLFILLFCLLSFSCTAQKIVLIDGKYYESKKLYSGVYTEYLGQDTIAQQITIKDGCPDGKTTLYYINGKVKEERYFINGKKDGLWITYLENGNKQAEARFSNDLKNGTWTIWDENGTKRYHMEYKAGEKTGTWLMWDESGKLIQEKNY